MIFLNSEIRIIVHQANAIYPTIIHYHATIIMLATLQGCLLENVRDI